MLYTVCGDPTVKRAAALPIRLRRPIRLLRSRLLRALCCFEKIPLPLFLFGEIDALAAESAPAHFGDDAHGEEGVGVDLLHFVFEPHQLARGDDGEEHVALLAQIPRLAVEHGDAAVEVVQDHLSDLGIAVADDLDLHLALPQRRDDFDDDGREHADDDTVEYCLHRGIGKKLQKDDGKIEHPQRDGDGDAEKVLQKEGRDVRAARARPHADDEPDARAEEKGTIEDIEKEVSARERRAVRRDVSRIDGVEEG